MPFFGRNSGTAATLFKYLNVAAIAAVCGSALLPVPLLADSTKAQSFVSPTRSISDITAILSERTSADPARLKKARELADRKPPATNDRSALARFYYKRGRAARRIGRVQQAIDDLSRANDLRSALPRKLQSRVLFYLGIAELSAGAREQGIAYTRQAMELAENESFRIQFNAHLSQYLLSSNPAEAARLLSDADRGIEKLRTSADPGLQREWAENRHDILGRVTLYRGVYWEHLGRYALAEQQFRSAIAQYERLYEKLDREWRRMGRNGFPAARRTLGNHALNALGRALLAQGRLIEAEVAVRTSLLNNLRQRGRNDRRTAQSIQQLARLLLYQGRPRDSESLQHIALDILHNVDAADGSKLIGDARSLLAHAMFAQRKWSAALKQFRFLETVSGGTGVLWEYKYSLYPVYPLALLRMGQPAEALSVARHAVDRIIGSGGNDRKLALARGTLAMALMASGRERESLTEFRKAAPVLLESERQSGFGLLDPVRDSRSRMVLEAYIGLLARIRGSALEREIAIDATGEAFRIADTLRGRSVQRALNASAARTATGNSELAALVRRMQDLVNQIHARHAHYANLLSRPGQRRLSGEAKTFPGSISALTAERDALRAEIERRFPRYASLVGPKPPSIGEARAQLRKGEALVAIHAGEAESYLWAVPQSGPATFARVPVGAAAISRLVESVLHGVVPRKNSLDGIRAFDVAAAFRLYRALLEPVAEGWRNAGTLLIAANGALTRLPFSLLVTQDGPSQDGGDALFSGYRRIAWLVRTHGVMALPSVSSLTTLRSLPPPKAGRRSFVGFADPRFTDEPRAPATKSQMPSGETMLVSRGLPLQFRATPPQVDEVEKRLASLPPLPDTATEVRSIASIMKADAERDLFIGVRANEHLVKTAPLDRYRVVSFASHALLPGQLEGLTRPALALSNPRVAHVAGDGLLTSDEVLDLKLDADWVVLSACNTAMGDGRGSEAVSGLGRAFLYAGARALLVSHWQVESESARRLVTDLFRRQAETPDLSRSAALRQAMLALIDGPGYTDADGRTVFSYAHPLFWAPFSVFGEGGQQS